MYWHSQAIAWLLEAKVLMNIQAIQRLDEHNRKPRFGYTYAKINEIHQEH